MPRGDRARQFAPFDALKGLQQALRLKDLGLPKKGGGYGNLNAKIKIVIPKSLNDKQIELYKKIAEL